jgi:hypothetical protein
MKARKLDEKGLSPLIGFVLMLMILMISISALQTTYVPSVCKEVEADHIKKLTSQLNELKDVPSSTKTINFDMGVDYPDYIFLITPKSTATTMNIRSFNVTVEYTEILANGTKINRSSDFTSYRIEITPNYVFYPDNTLILENTAIFKYAGNNYITMSEQSVFGDVINFVLYDVGFQSISTTQSLSIISVPSSTGGRIIVENLTITFDSAYPEYWENLDDYDVTVNGNRVTVHKDGSMLLTLKHLSLYSGTQLSSTSSSPVRIIKVNALDNFSLKSGESVTLAAKVLDSYNNPVEGVAVTVNSTIGSVSPSTLYTDSDGEVYTVFSAGDAGTGTVYFNCENCSSEQITSYDVSVTSSTGSNSSVSITLTSSPPAETDGYSSKTINAYISSNGEALPGFEVRFAVNNSDANLDSTEATTNYTGYATTSISQSAEGKHWYKVYGYAGSILDYITVLLNTTLPSNIHILKIYVENSGSEDLTDYPVEILITNSTLINMMQDDGSGIRFFESLVSDPYTESAGKIPHWIEEQPSTGALDVWVNLDLSSGENKSIYMYFNGTASTESNGTAVFDFFDDFDDGDISDWTSVNANIQAQTFDGKKTLKLSPSGSTNFKHFAVPDDTISLETSYILEAYMYDDRPAGGPLLHYVDDGNWWGIELYTGGNKDIFRPYIGNSDKGWVYYNSPCSISSDDWYKIKIIAESDSFKMYIDDSLMWDRDVGSQYQLSGYNKIGIVEHKNYGPIYTDWIFTRKYVEVEPIVSIGELIQ